MNIIFTTATFTARLANGTYRSATVPAVATREELEDVLLDTCNNYSGAFRATLTGGHEAPTFLQAVLKAGWQQVNYLFEDGQWFLCEGLLSSQRRPLSNATTAATALQLQLVNRVTKSHVFEADRLIIRQSAQSASEEECSILIDWMLKEVKARKDSEKSYQLAA